MLLCPHCVRGQANVTWSDEEYGHPGLQHMYLRYKSFQRFTETYALLERAEMRSLFSGDGAFTPKPTGRPLRVASIGGGPGCENSSFSACHFNCCLHVCCACLLQCRGLCPCFVPLSLFSA